MVPSLQSSDAVSDTVLRLYIAGNTPNSQKALVNARRICEVLLNGRYRLEVIDIFRNPELFDAAVVAPPALVGPGKGTARMAMGDLSDHQKVLGALGFLPDSGH